MINVSRSIRVILGIHYTHYNPCVTLTLLKMGFTGSAKIVMTTTLQYGRRVIWWFLLKLQLKYVIISENDQFLLRKTLLSWWCDICWGLYQTNMYSFIWRTRFLGQGLSAVQECFIVMLFSHTLLLFQRIWFWDLDITPGHTAILIILRLIVQP